MIIKYFLAWTGMIVIPFTLIAQDDYSNPTDLKGATEFTIPVSPAFDILGINPSQVTRPANIRDIKVDWSFRSWRLKPNIALQAQPIWEFMYNRPNLAKYRKASGFMQTLSTLDISAGTIEDDDLTRRLSVAVKLNVLRERDPLLDAALYQGVDASYQEASDALDIKVGNLKSAIKSKEFSGKKDSLEKALDYTKKELYLLDQEQRRKIQELAKNYIQEFWNTSYLDVAYGRLYAYNNDTLSNLQLKGSGYALWVNGCIGFGKKCLLSSIVKYLSINPDVHTFTENNHIFSIGSNFRYGSPRFNFFVEAFYSDANEESIAFKKSTVALTQVSKFSLSYGGDWRISRNVLLTYGVRTNYDSGMSFKSLVPIASVSCLMR